MKAVSTLSPDFSQSSEHLLQNLSLTKLLSMVETLVLLHFPQKLRLHLLQQCLRHTIEKLLVQEVHDLGSLIRAKLTRFGENLKKMMI